MDQTDIWMVGVVAFGAVFYLFAVYFNRQADDQDDVSEHSGE